MTDLKQPPAAPVGPFIEQQLWWLDRIDDVIPTSAGVSFEVIDEEPFSGRGGVDGAVRDLAVAATYPEQVNAKLTA